MNELRSTQDGSGGLRGTSVFTWNTAHDSPRGTPLNGRRSSASQAIPSTHLQSLNNLYNGQFYMGNARHNKKKVEKRACK